MNYAGIAGAAEGTKQTRSYEAEYNQRNNDIKSSTIKNRLAPGSMSVYNYDGAGKDNSFQKIKFSDSLQENNRHVQAMQANLPYNIPNMSTMGKRAPEIDMYNNIQEQKQHQMDQSRFDPHLLINQLKQNPYALDINQAFG